MFLAKELSLQCSVNVALCGRVIIQQVAERWHTGIAALSYTSLWFTGNRCLSSLEYNVAN